MAFRLFQNRGVSRLQKRQYSTALPKFVANIGPAKLTSLPNGVRVVTEEPVAQTGAASVQLWVRAGSSHETAQTNGVASLLQRLSVKAKAAEVAKFGGKLTGGVCREYTVYTAECLAKDVPHAVRALGEIAAGLNFSEEVLQKEKAALVANVSGLVDSWNEATLLDHAYAAAYQGTSFERSPTGEKATTKALEKSHVDGFRAAQYTGNNIVLSISGPETNAEAFSGLAAGKEPTLPSRLDFTGSQMNIRDDTVHNAQIVIGYETVPFTDKNWAALQILQAILGKWRVDGGLDNNGSSRLAELIATEKLADAFSTFNHQSAASGFFGLYANTHNVDQLDDLIYEIFHEYQKVYQFLYDGDLTRSANQVTSNYLTSIASPSGQAYDAGKQVLGFGRRMSPAEAVARFQNVSAKEVQELVETYFNDVDPVVIAHGQLEEMPDYGILRGWTYWNRR